MTGSCSHPTGVGLGQYYLPTTITGIVGLIVLLFQALLLAHGGLTTLGPILFYGSSRTLVSYGIFKLLNKYVNTTFTVFLAAFGGFDDLCSYSNSSALAFPDSVSGFIGSLGKFLSVFAVTQIPLAIVEGIITAIVYNLLIEYSKEGVIKIETIK